MQQRDLEDVHLVLADRRDRCRGSAAGPRRGRRGTRRATPASAPGWPNDVATGLSPTCVGQRRARRPPRRTGRAAGDPGRRRRGPTRARRPGPTRGRDLGDLGEAPDRLVGRARCRGRPRPSAISNQTHAPIALVARARSTAGSSSSRASRVATGVGERVRLVDEVLGDAAPRQPAGQLGVLGRRPAGDRRRLVVAPDADQAGRGRARQLDPRARRRRPGPSRR